MIVEIVTLVSTLSFSPHSPAVLMTETHPPVCRHYARRGACAYGDACKFAHTATDGPATAPDAPSTTRRGTRKWRTRAGRQKVKFFVRFLCRVFTPEQRARVVDVAGGNGKLSFELLNAGDGASEVTVVDPRKMRGSWLAERFARRLKLRDVCEVRAPTHARVYWTREMWDLEDEGAWENAVGASRNAAVATRWSTSGLVVGNGKSAAYEDGDKSRRVKVTSEGVSMATVVGVGDGDDGDNGEDCGVAGEGSEDEEEQGEQGEEEEEEDDDFVEELSFEATLDAIRRVVNDSTLVVALHPDQATDAALDFALERKLPFAIVPCCVYAKEFGKRRLADGSRVTSPEQLVEYLRQRAASFGADARVETLPFPGKNVVVYSHGADAIEPLCVAIEEKL